MKTISQSVKFIESIFGSGIISGGNLNIKCPECGDSSKKKLSIRLEDHLLHCWVCGHSGRTLLPLIRKHGSREQIEEYRTRFLPELLTAAETLRLNHSTSEIPVLQLPSDYRLLALEGLSKDRDTQEVLVYLKARGIGERELWHWKLGISNEYKWRRRVIMPSFDMVGNLNYYVARSIDKVPYMKYINCEIDKITIVFNELNINWTKPLTLVEGPFDLAKVRSNATCLLGSSLSERGELFHRILVHETPIILMLDDEMKTKSQKIARMLNSYAVPTSIATTGNHHDPGEMKSEEVDTQVATAKQWEWSDYFADKLRVLTSGSHLSLKKTGYYQ